MAEDYTWILNWSNLSPKQLKKAARIGEREKNICANCGNPTTFHAGKTSSYFLKYCSPACRKAGVGKRLRETCLDRYGSICALANPEVKQKTQDTIQARYGNDPWGKDGTIRSAITKTLENEFGGRSPFCSSRVQGKAKKTIRKKYGVANVMQDDSVKAKVKATSIKKYGVDNPSKCQTIIDKIAATNIERYGRWNGADPEINKRRKATNLKRWGVPNPMQCDVIKDKLRDAFNRIDLPWQKWSPQIESKVRSLAEQGVHPYDIAAAVGISYTQLWVWSRRNKIELPVVMSHPQQTILDLVKQTLPAVHVQSNVRTVIPPKEIDVYIPDMKLGIEVNGSFWHSDWAYDKDKLYHWNKWNEANAKGVDLIQVYDFELDSRRIGIIKSWLLVRSGNAKKISARSCKLLNVDSPAARAFLTENHWQGFAAAKHHSALIHDGAIVGLLSYGNSRFEKDTLECIRLCFTKNTVVVGGLSRMLKHVDGNEMISYSDNRLFSGSSLSDNFVRADTKRRIGYCWVKNGSILKRYQTQPKKLAMVLGPDYDASKTEDENMRAAGWYKLYDAGQTKWVMKLLNRV